MIENGLPPIHPGQFLREILDERHLTQAQLARAIDISPMRISHIVNGTRPITAPLALLLARAFGQSPEYWLNLQTTYDLKTTAFTIAEQLQKVPELT